MAAYAVLVRRVGVFRWRWEVCDELSAQVWTGTATTQRAAEEAATRLRGQLERIDAACYGWDRAGF